MKKYLFYLIIFLTPVLNRAGSEMPYQVSDIKSDIYSELNLSEYGLSNEVFQLALTGYNKLEAEGRLENPGIITIVDFSRSSKNKRMYVIDFLNHKLLFNTLVAHGKNTGEEYAKNFSNKLGTLKSSLGFYVTKNHVMGQQSGCRSLFRVWRRDLTTMQSADRSLCTGLIMRPKILSGRTEGLAEAMVARHCHLI